MSASKSPEEKLRKEMENEDQLSDAIYQFNKNPKKGIVALCQYYHIECTPHLVAHLLQGNENLSSKKVGEFLTASGNEKILDSYFDHLDLETNVLTAIRRCFCGQFHVPPDSEKIDSAIQSCSRVYFKQNPEKFRSVEEVYSVMYSLILLNSDVNNPKNPRPMTLAQFVANIRTVIKPEQLSDNQLKSLYNDVKSNPLSFSAEASGNFLEMSAPTFKGNLKKKTDNWKSFWTEHFFVLANSCLYYFQSDLPIYKDQPLGCIQIVGLKVSKGTFPRTITLESNSGIRFNKFKKHGPVQILGVKKLFLEAPTDKMFQRWLYRLQATSNMDQPLKPPHKGDVPSDAFEGIENARQFAKLGSTGAIMPVQKELSSTDDTNINPTIPSAAPPSPKTRNVRIMSVDSDEVPEAPSAHNRRKRAATLMEKTTIENEEMLAVQPLPRPTEMEPYVEQPDDDFSYLKPNLTRRQSQNLDFITKQLKAQNFERLQKRMEKRAKELEEYEETLRKWQRKRRENRQRLASMSPEEKEAYLKERASRRLVKIEPPK